MQAIETRYLGPTNTRGARIKATSASGISRTVPYDHAENSEGAHWQAAKALAESLGWSGYWAAFTVNSNARGFVFARIMNAGAETCVGVTYNTA